MEIRASKEPATTIALRYGVSTSTVYSVRRGDGWKSIGGEVQRRRTGAHTVTITCGHCGSVATRKQKPSAPVPQFCQRQCYWASKKGTQPVGWVKTPPRTQEKHHGWLGDEISEVGGRKRALKWFPKKPCEVCGEERVDRHHKDGNTRNNSDGNIAFLCRRHHMEADGRIPTAKVVNP